MSLSAGLLALLPLVAAGMPAAEPAAAAPGESADTGGESAYIIRLVDALEHDDAYKVRLQAAVLLGRSKRQRAVEPLLQALAGDSESTVRAAAATALGLLGDSRAITPLMQRLALDHDGFVRDEAAQALRGYPRDRALPYVMAAYGSEEPAVRKQVLLYLTSEPSPVMEPVLVSALGDTADVFAPAAAAIGKLPPPDALHILESAAGNRNPAVRRGAITVLRSLGTPEATHLILEVYERDIEVDEVRAATRSALRELRRFLPLQQIVDDAGGGEKHVRAHALKLLGVLGGDSAERTLLAALQADDTYIRGTAVLALGDLGNVALIPTLEKLADDPANQRIARLIRHALAQLRDLREHPTN